MHFMLLECSVESNLYHILNNKILPQRKQIFQSIHMKNEMNEKYGRKQMMTN